MIALNDRAFIVNFEDLDRWDPTSFHGLTWYWPDDLLQPIGSCLKVRKEKVDRKVVAFNDLQPITIHFDGSMDRRKIAPNREYTMDLYYAKPGDFVVAKIDLKNGAVGIVPDDWHNVVVTGHFAVYEPDHDRIYLPYLHRIIQAAFFKAYLWRNKVGAEGRKEVKLDFFQGIKIPLPSLAVQQAIVAHWKKSHEEAARLRERITSLEKELPLVIYDLLGTPPPIEATAGGERFMVLPWSELERWSLGYLQRARQGLLGFTESRYPIRRLETCLVDTMNGYCIKPVSTVTPFKMLKLSALTPSGLDLSESKFVPVEEKTAVRFTLKKGDLLICRSSGSPDQVAKCALVGEDLTTMLFPDIIIRARCNEKVIPEYVREVMQTPLGRSHFRSQARTAVGMWKIGAEDIRNFPLPLPPLEVQAEIVEEVKARRAEISREKARAEELLKQATADVEAMILGTLPPPSA